MPPPAPTSKPHKRVVVRKTRAGTPSTAGAGAPRLTPDEVVDRVNRGTMSVEAGDAVLAALGEPRLHTDRDATFTVPVAVQVPGDARPAAAMACLDMAVREAVARMAWCSVVDDSPDGYAIDPPSRSVPSAGPGVSTVHADLRLTVTVPAYRTHQFPDTALDLLRRDLRQLRRHHVQAGAPRRCHLRDDDPWSPYLDALHHRNVHHSGDRLYDEGDLFDVDPFDPFHLDPVDLFACEWRRLANARAW